MARLAHGRQSGVGSPTAGFAVRFNRVPLTRASRDVGLAAEKRGRKHIRLCKHEGIHKTTEKQGLTAMPSVRSGVLAALQS